MGLLSRDTIIATGLELAGDSSLTTQAQTWLALWLQDALSDWPWPHLTARYGPFTISAGQTVFTLGNGTNTADKIYGIRHIAIADTSNDGYKGDLALMGRDTIDPVWDPAWLSSGSTSIPTQALIEVDGSSGSNGWRWNIYPSPVPDKSYRLLVTASRMPAVNNLTGSDPIPYPNDRTAVMAIYTYALKHQQDEREQGAIKELNAQVAVDKVKYGKYNGQQVNMNLSRVRFPMYGGTRRWRWW